MTTKKATKASQSSVDNVNTNCNPFVMLPIAWLTTIARHKVTVGTRNKGTLDLKLYESHVALLGFVAKQAGFETHYNHSVKYCVSIIDPLTKRIVATIHSNSLLGGNRLYLNCCGTNTTNNPIAATTKLSEAINAPITDLKKQWLESHGTLEKLAFWQTDIAGFTDILTAISPLCQSKGNKQKAVHVNG